MDLPRLTDLDVAERKVVVRIDLDLPKEDDSRLEASRKTLDYLVNNKAKMIIISHKGRPNGVISQSLSLSKYAEKIEKLVGAKTEFVYDIVGAEAQEKSKNLREGEVMLLENLRFDKRESLDFALHHTVQGFARDKEAEAFVRSLASLADFYVNEAFAVSHRPHASIVGIPRFLPHAAGFRFALEVENLSKVFEDPRSPVVVIVSGVKEDKVEMVKALAQKFDRVLVGGRLPLLIQNSKFPEKLHHGASKIQNHNSKIKIASLREDLLDIDEDSIQMFKEEIVKAGTVVLVGVMGKYEEESHRRGTKEVFEAVANSDAYKVAGGGDTGAALTMFGLTGKFDWISVGGGAMLEFLAKGTLPGIEALLH